MPSASTAKPEKPASSEAQDPIRLGIVFVEHKIRNLLKKKSRLDTYQEIQKSGKELDADQKLALKKYDELCQNLVFAQEFSKHLSGLVIEADKLLKKKQKKEAYEREQQEAAKVKEILVIQDVLASMGTDIVREDFLAGKNKACKLTETELQYLDELFVEVAPKREPDEGQPPFLEQAQNAAKHLLSIVEGKDKEIVGTKYSSLKELIDKINNCGYFDSSAQEPIAQEVEVEVAEVQPAEIPEPEPEVEPEVVPTTTFQPRQSAPVEPVVAPTMETAGLYISQRPMADVLTNVMGAGPTTFNFIQESELETPDVGAVPVPVPAAAPLPIPTQTFTNANFVPQAPQDVLYGAPAPALPHTHAQFSPTSVPPAANTAPVQTFESATFQNQTTQGSASGDWSDANTEQNDWAMAVEQSEENRWSEPAQQTDEWNNDNSNDGFQTAGRGGSRGRGRGGNSDRGRGGSRGRGNYQNGRGNYGNREQNGRGGGGGGYYNRNSEGGYQNGYQSRGDGERGGYRDRGDGERGGYNRDRGNGDRGSYRDRGNGERGGYRDRGDGERVGYRDRGDRDGGPRRGGPRGGGQDRGGPRGGRDGAPRGGGGRGGNPRGGRGSQQ